MVLAKGGDSARLARQDGFMAALKDRLRTDLTAAMRARDEVRLRTLRMALTSITKEEVAGDSARELSDDEVTAVLTLGQVMKVLTPRVAGRAEGARVAAEVRRQLTS
jgi:uncharacterized protein YqeY